jgi:hypothetical protein
MILSSTIPITVVLEGTAVSTAMIHFTIHRASIFHSVQATTIPGDTGHFIQDTAVGDIAHGTIHGTTTGTIHGNTIPGGTVDITITMAGIIIITTTTTTIGATTIMEVTPGMTTVATIINTMAAEEMFPL